MQPDPDAGLEGSSQQPQPGVTEQPTPQQVQSQDDRKKILDELKANRLREQKAMMENQPNFLPM